MRTPAAIDFERLAGDEIRIIRDEKADSVCNFCRLAKTIGGCIGQVHVCDTSKNGPIGGRGCVAML